MKKILGLVAAALFGMTMVVGCQNPLDPNSDSITIAAVTAMNVSQTQTVKVSYEASDVPTLTVAVTPASAGVTATIATVSAKSGDVDATISTTATPTTGTYTLTVTMVAAGVTTTKATDFTVTGSVAVDTLAILGVDTIWNFNGKGPGAFDLVSEAQVFATTTSTATKDLLDITTVGTAMSGSVNSPNGATFVTLAATDWTGATAASLKTAVASATATSGTFTANQYVGVKLGNSRGYAIVKVVVLNTTSVYGDQLVTSLNKGYIAFQYKFTTD